MIEFLGKRKYPVDLSGTSPDNKVTDERHKIYAEWRAIVPDHAPFYSSTVRIHLNGRDLRVEEDYVFKDLDAEKTAKSNQSVYNTIVFKDNGLVGDVYITYQCYGDPIYPGVLSKYIEQLKEDHRNINWVNINNKPLFYPPEPHQHFANDVYGLGPMARGLHAIAQALVAMHGAGNQQVYGIVQNFASTINRRMDAFDDQVRTMKSVDTVIAEVRGQTNEAVDGIRTEILTGLREGTIPTQGMTDEQRTEVLATAREEWQRKATELASADSSFRTTLNSYRVRIERLEARPVTTDNGNNSGITAEALETMFANRPEITRISALETSVANKVDTATYEAGIQDASLKAHWNNVTNKPTIIYRRAKSTSLPDNWTDGARPWATTTNHGTLWSTLVDGNGTTIYIDKDGLLQYRAITSGTDTGWVPLLTWDKIQNKPTRFPSDWRTMVNIPPQVLAPTWASITGKPSWIVDNLDLTQYARKTSGVSEVFNSNVELGGAVGVKNILSFIPRTNTQGTKNIELSIPDANQFMIDDKRHSKQFKIDFHNGAVSIADKRLLTLDDLTWANLKNVPTNLGTTNNAPVLTWDAITNKPTSFPTAWTTISGIPAQATRWPTWNEVTGKPAQATRWPTWEEITGKPTNLGSSWANITDVPATLARAVGSNFSDFVTLSEAQTIIGVKTFTNGIVLSGGTLLNSVANEFTLGVGTAGNFKFKADGITHGAKRLAYVEELAGVLKVNTTTVTNVTTPLYFKNSTMQFGLSTKTTPSAKILAHTDDTFRIQHRETNNYFGFNANGVLVYNNARVLTETDLTSLNSTIDTIRTSASKLDGVDVSKLVRTDTTQTISGTKSFTDAAFANSFKVTNGANTIVVSHEADGLVFKLAGTTTPTYRLKTNGQITFTANASTNTSVRFATLDDLTWANLKNVPTNFMLLSGNQTVAGIKTFNSDVKIGTTGTIKSVSNNLSLINTVGTATGTLNVGTTTLRFNNSDVLTKAMYTANGADGIVNTTSGMTNVSGLLRFNGIGNTNGKTAVIALDAASNDLVFDKAIRIPNATLIDSDRRLKSNIKPIENATEKLSTLQGYTYTLNKLDDVVSAGTIAQEVQEVFPEFVHTDENGGLSLNYNGLIGALLSGFRELNERVKALESKNS